MSVLSTCIKAHLENKKIVFFAAGQHAIQLLRNTKRMVAYFCDNAADKQGSVFHDLQVYHPNKLLEEDRETTVVIISTPTYQGIAKQLFDMGFVNVYADGYKNANEAVPSSMAEEQMLLLIKAKALSAYDLNKVESLFADKLSVDIFNHIIDKYKRSDTDFSDIRSQEMMYFNSVFENDMQNDEVYVDAGAFDGKTIVDFILFARGKYKKIYAFEPDIISSTAYSKDFLDIPGLIWSCCGLSDTDGEAVFDAQGSPASGIMVNGESSVPGLIKIKTVKLDNVVCEPVTFIKIDIEGADYEALIGAKELIKKYKPKLAVAVYHKDDDLVRIPLLLNEVVPEYKFYLRHHMISYEDTVLYAKV